MPDPLLRGVSMWRIYVPSVMTDLDFFPFFFFRFFFFSSSFRRTKVFFSLSPTAWRFQHDVGHISKTLFAKDTFFTRSVFSLPLHARVCVFVDANYVLAALCTHKDEEKRVRRRREKREREREREKGPQNDSRAALERTLLVFERPKCDDQVSAREADVLNEAEWLKANPSGYCGGGN